MADRGTSLSSFADFILATRQASISDPGKLVSQASKYKTSLLPLMLKGLSPKKMIQGGSEITDFIQLSYTNRRQDRNFGDTYSFTASNSLVQMTLPWRMHTVDSVVYEHELDLQQGGKDVVFKKVKDAKMAELELSFWEGGEDALWADPDFDKMEAGTLTGVGKQMSLRAYITDDGLFPTASNGGIASGSSAWTSIMGVSTTTYPNWRNTSATFDGTSDTAMRTGTRSVLRALDKAFRKVQWQPPESTKQWVEETKMNKLRIVCNGLSKDFLVDEARERNNVLTPSGDLGWAQGQVTYKGIPIQYIAKLDNIDTDTANNPGEEALSTPGATTKAFKYRLINFNHFYPVWHPKHYRRMRNLDGGVSNPNAMVMLEDSYCNLWCANRREHAVVYAAAS